MICLVTAVALVANYRSALAWADRLYAKCEPFARIDSPGFYLGETLDAYRQVAAVYGERSELRLRKAACLISMGDYKSAAIEAPPNSKELQTAMRRRDIGLQVANVVGQPALQVEPVPGSNNQFLVLSGKKTRSPESPSDWAPAQITKVKLSLIRSVGTVRILSTKTFPDHDEELPVRWTELYCTRLQEGGSAAVSVHLDYPAGDSDPSEDDLFRVSSHRLTRFARFHSLYGTEIRPPIPGHALTVINFSTWKIDWPDAYEWTGNGFRLSNAEHPELYSITKLLERIKRDIAYITEDGEHGSWPLYPDYEFLAATLDVHRQFGRALAAWKRAESLCRRAIRNGLTEGHMGKAPINLLEIRQRIRWLRHREYGHLLLYRPYDWNLQIPPRNLAQGHRSADAE